MFPKINISPKKGPVQKENHLVFQPSFFRADSFVFLGEVRNKQTSKDLVIHQEFIPRKLQHTRRAHPFGTPRSQLWKESLL